MLHSATNSATSQTPMMIKLGTKNSGFYHEGINKEYTELQMDKMPYQVLSILQGDIVTQEIGISTLTLSDRLLKIRPDLAIDDYGYSTTLPILLKDFEKAELVELYRGKVKITPLGIRFSKSNIIG